MLDNGRRLSPTAVLFVFALVNGDGSISVADIFYLINFLFARGPAPL